MSAEEQLQHEHAQWLASLASGHFEQQVVGSQDSGGQSDNPLSAEEDQAVGAAVSVQPIVRLDYEEPLTVPVGQPIPSLPFNLRRKRKEREDNSRSDEYKLFPSKDRGTKVQDMRRPVRPIDRQKMRPWLKNLLDSGAVFGLNWLKREEGIFQISWRHASRLGWNLETDGDVFERWARHTGIFKDGDDPEPKRWKANFRCALHSLPDVKELTCPAERKGRNATRTYRFLRPGEVEPPVKRKQRYSIQIPYNVYERQVSEDSGSAHAESDERNTDEEPAAALAVAVEQQPRAFPLCDHDYAIRSDCTDDEQITSAVLAKHNSGFVLIKSKDAHEFEFRLTAQDSELQLNSTKKSAPGPDKSSSARKKGKEGKKRAPPVRKGKASKAVPAKGKRVKKVKKASVKESSPATKVSLKALLSGRKSATKKGGKALVKMSPAPAKKAATEESKKAGAAAKDKGKKDTDSGPGTPTQSQGLQALLEAASQIDRLDALTTSPATATTTAKSISPARVTRRSAAATAVSAAILQPVVSATVQSFVASSAAPPTVAAPVIFTTQPLLTAGAGMGAGMPSGATVLAPLQPGISPVGLPPQISMAVLHKLLGLSPLPPGTVATVNMAGINSIPVQVIPSTVLSAKTSVIKTAPVQIGRVARRTSAAAASNKPAGVSAAVTPAVKALKASTTTPLLMNQPEAGTSMLKHLLRLTGPAVPSTSAGSAFASHIIPAAPKIFSTHVATSASKTKELTAEVWTPAAPPMSVVQSVETEHLTDSYMVGQLELGSSQDISCNEAVPESFPYIPVSTSKVYIKSEDGEISEASASSSDITNDPTVTVSHTTFSVQESLESTAEEHYDESNPTSQAALSEEHYESNPTSQAALSEEHYESNPTSQAVLSDEHYDESNPTSQAVLSETHFDLPASAMPSSESGHTASAATTNAARRVTLCLAQDISMVQTLPTSSQTVMVTLPHISLPATQGQGMSAASFPQSMDLMQFLNLFAASGSSQVIIKAESPVQSDIIAMNESYSAQAAVSSSPSKSSFVRFNKSSLPALSTPAEQDQTGMPPAEGEHNPDFSSVDITDHVLAEPDEGEHNPDLSSVDITDHVMAEPDEGEHNPDFSSVDITDHVMAEPDSHPSSSAEEVFMQVSEDEVQVSVRTVNVVEVVPNQFIMNEADISSLTADHGVEVVPNQFIMNEADISSLTLDHQGAPSFVVDSML